MGWGAARKEFADAIKATEEAKKEKKETVITAASIVAEMENFAALKIAYTYVLCVFSIPKVLHIISSPDDTFLFHLL